MKLFSRYNRIIMAIMVLIFLLSSILYYYFLNYILIGEVDKELNYRRAKTERYARINGKLPIPDGLGDVQVAYTLTDKATSVDKLSLISLFDSSENKIGIFRKYVFTIQAGHNYYQVTLVRPLQGTKRLSRLIVLVTLSMILVIIISSLLINRTLLKKLWKPFYETISVMRKFKLGKVKEVKLPDTKIEEFAFLNENLKDTIQKAEEEYQVLKEFSENASHELQTPLALIRSKLDLLIQSEDLSESQSEELKEIYSAVKRLSRLSVSLLLLTKIENQQFELVTKIKLKEKIEEKVAQFQELWKSNQIRVYCTINPSVIIANIDLIDILLNNLLSNASKHNINGGTINIELNENQLEIANTGTPKALDTNRIFRRFYKEKSYSHHNGLGLSIIKQICDQSNILITYHFNNGIHYFKLIW